MQVVASVLIWFAVLLIGGCTVWQEETTNRGGYLDYVLDQHWLKADSKRMRALRAYAIQVSLARIASVSAKNDADRQLLAIRIGASNKKFLPVYQCALKGNPLDIPGAEKDPCFYFDSAMVEYSTGLFDLAMVALPLADAKNLLNAVTGNPINYLDLLNELLVIGRDALTYGRVVGALYRDTVELEVQVWLATPAIDNRPPPYRVTEADVAALREIYAVGNDNMPAWLSAIAALRDRGLEPLPDPKFFAELGGLMRYICDLITKDPTASASCKAGLPTTILPPAPAVGPPVAARIGVVQPVPKPVRVITPAEPTYSALFVNYTPERYRPSYVKRIQAALCVPTSEQGDIGTFTTNLVAIYQQASHEPLGKLDDRDIAQILSPPSPNIPCSSTGAKNYYERITYTDADKVSALIKRLNKSPAGGQLAENTTLADARSKIRAVRTALSESLLQLPDPLADQMTRDLDIALFNLH